MGLKSFVIPDLTLGLNQQARPHALRPGEATDLKNLTMGAGGTELALRNGTTPRQSTMPDGPATKIFWWEEAQSMFYLGVFTNSLYVSGLEPTSGFTFIQQFCFDFEVAKDNAGNETMWVLSAAAGPYKLDAGASYVGAWLAPGGPSPGQGRLCKLWKERMVISGDAFHPGRLYYSPIGDPEGTYNFIDIRSAYDDSEPITEMELIGDNLLVFKESSTWLIYDSNTFANRRLGGPGCFHQGLTGEFRERVYFLGRGGLHSTDGITAPRLESTKIPAIATVVAETLVTAGGGGSVVITENQYSSITIDPVEERLILLLYSIADNQTRMWEMYFPQSKNNPHKEEIWYFHDFASDIFAIGAVKAKLGHLTTPTEMLVCSVLDAGGAIYQLFAPGSEQDGPSAARVYYNPYWESGWFRIGESIEAKERIRRVNFDIRPSSAPGVAQPTAKWWVDDAGVPGGVTLGAPFFNAPMQGSEPSFRRIRPEARGRWHKLAVSSTTSADRFYALVAVEAMYRGGTEH